MPTKTLISIISDQTLPNVLFAREFGPFDRHVFVSTKEMDAKQKPRALKETLGLSTVEEVEVLEDSPQDIAQKLGELPFKDEEEIVVNLTGGNKVMAIGVYNFFVRRNSKIFYIPIGHNKTVQLHPEVMQRERDLKYRVSLAEYLQSYQVEVEAGSFQKKNTFFDSPSLFMKMYALNANPLFNKNWRLLREKPAQQALSQNGFINLKDYVPIANNLAQINYRPSQPNTLSKAACDYFAGQWLEEYIYDYLVNHLILQPHEIGLNIRINEEPNKRLHAGNEFDILFVKDNKLYVVECKTGTRDEHFNDYAYKLAALSDFFGLGVKLVLFIKNGPHKSEVKEWQSKRAKLLKIKLMYGEELLNPTQFMQHILK